MEDGICLCRAVFHFPSAILHLRLLLCLALALCLAGCAPPGPRALLKGKKLLDRGDIDGAVRQLKTATTLMATNAAAWNYYGVALQHAGDGAGAADAYQNALKFNRDLVEAHYNLGCLRLEQNKPDAAWTEFKAYTLQRNNTPEGWLKLGETQLRLGDAASAEKSFATALSINTNNAEGLNGMGLARVRRGLVDDAARFFTAAVQFHPDYAPAILNLAVVNQQYLHEDQAALDNYRRYLALTPRPPDWDAVNALVNNSPARPVAVAAAVPPRPPPAAATPRPNSSPAPVVQVQPPPAIAMEPAAEPQPAAQRPGAARPSNPARSYPSPRGSQNYAQTGVTPLTAASPAPTVTAAPKHIRILPPAPPTFPRYLYLSPRKPRAGDRKAAEAAFASAQQSEHQGNPAAAMDSYRQAAELDPAWFEAQYNYAVLAYRQQDYSRSLAACEMALAIQPGSTDARYIFALALKAAGFMTDAVNELNKIVAEKPDETRAHLALGNLYAREMQDAAKARREYLTVLQLDPHNPAAGVIQFWLSDNPQ